MKEISITMSVQEENWIKSQIDSGCYCNESEAIRELIEEQQISEQETPEEIAAIRAALIEGEESIKKYGYSKKTVREIWEEEKAKYLANQDG